MNLKTKLRLYLFILIYKLVFLIVSLSADGSPPKNLNQPLITNPNQQTKQSNFNDLESATTSTVSIQTPPATQSAGNLNVLVPQNNLKPLIQTALAIAPKLVQPTTILNESLQLQSALSSRVSNLSSSSPPIASKSGKIQQANQILKPATVITNLDQANYGNAEDPIQYLDYSSMSDEILKRQTANFVYFNANFNHCRHCNKLFQIWKEMAIDIRWWGQVIKLSSINCSDEDNFEVCRRAGATQFPQVRYYWCMSSSLERDGQRLRILGKSVHAMRHLIMDKVLDSYIEHNKALNQAIRQQGNQKVNNNNIGSANGIAIGGGVSGNGGGQIQPALASLMSMPMISQLLNGNINNANSNSSPSNKLTSLMSLFLGGKTDGSNNVNLGSIFGTTNNQQSNNLAGLTGTGLVSSLNLNSNLNSGSNQIMNALMSVNSMLPQKITQPLGNNWPELEPIEVDDAQQLVNMLPLDTVKNIGALLIMETQEFLYTGLEVMLDLNPYADQTYIARVRDDRSQLSRNLTKRDDIQAPAIIYVTPLREAKLIMTAPKYTNDEDLRRAFVRAFERRQIKYPVKRVWSMPTQSIVSTKTNNGADSQEDEDLLSRVNLVFMNDLTNSIRASLMEQVFRHPDLSDDQYNALVKYVYSLINYFPFNNDESLKFFKRLHTWLQNQVSPMDIGEYKKQFHDINEVLPQKEWTACKSLSNTKAIPAQTKKSLSLFENPAQLGKVVSNITRLFRGNQQQSSKIKTLFSMFTSSGSTSPVMLNQNQSQSQNQYTAGSTNHGGNYNKNQQQQQSGNNNGTVHQSHGNKQDSAGMKKEADSPIERIIKSLTSGSLGSDSSILKLISTALTGSSNGDSANSSRSKFAREYPCGVWKLAHVMAVNEYIKDSPRKDVKHIVLHSLYQYMLHFYTCSTCGNRVSDVSGEFRIHLDEHLQDQGDSVLLLWKIHNRVNKRLESESRPGSPTKIQFPTEFLCQKCRAPRAQTDLISTPNWHEKQVLNFLVHHYRPQSIITNSSSSSSFSSSGAISLLTMRKNSEENRPNMETILICLFSLASSFLITSLSYPNKRYIDKDCSLSC